MALLIQGPNEELPQHRALVPDIQQRFGLVLFLTLGIWSKRNRIGLNSQAEEKRRMMKDKRDKLAGIWGHQLMLLLRQSDLQQLATPTISITNKMADAHGVPPFLSFLPHDIFWSSSTWRRWLNCSIKAERNHDRCCWRCDVKLACDGAVRQQRLCHAKGGTPHCRCGPGLYLHSNGTGVAAQDSWDVWHFVRLPLKIAKVYKPQKQGIWVINIH